MSPPAISFDEYALDSAAKFRPGSEELLLANRIKLLRKAYRPLFPALRSARRILDFGCGAGELLCFLHQVSDAQLYGFDPSRSQRELARTRCRDLPRVHCLSDLGEMEEKFDLVFSSHVIEHVPDAELPGFVSSMLERLTPDGRLVVATPNGLNPFAHAYFMATDRTHLRMHSAFTLSELVRPFGCEVLEAHRETPQAYDVPSFAKTAVWWLLAQLLRLGVCATAGGVRGLRFPFLMAPTFYCVIGRVACEATREAGSQR